jgi:hypothetical protein
MGDRQTQMARLTVRASSCPTEGAPLRPTSVEPSKRDWCRIVEVDTT